MPYPSLSVVRKMTQMTLVRGMPWVLGGQNDPNDQKSEVRCSLLIFPIAYCIVAT